MPDGERYAVLREFARGGLGRVLEAKDRRLNRSVALKELIRSGDEEDEARFVREALITARLEHPAIVPVHDVGRWQTGQPYIAMKMISGRSLGELIGERKTLEERLALLPNIIAVADAMAYAHSKRVIHRDLNPSNILIGSFGETVIIDWGLVADLSNKQGGSLIGSQGGEKRIPPKSLEERKHAEGPHSLTMTGVVLGTAEYMPLEQARGEVVDERADVYAIGAILYHVLAGAPPYQGEDANKIIEEVLERPPEPIERKQRRLAGELITIVQKAMAREAKDRYRTAKDLADDLKRFQTGQLVSAHSYSLLGLISHRLRTYRLPVKAVAAGVVALMVLGVFAFHRVIQQKLAEAARNERILIEARSALDTDPTAALAWLKHYPVSANNWETVRDIALQALDAGPARLVLRAQSSYHSYSPDGRRLAIAAASKSIQIWDLPSGRLLKELPHSGRVHSTKFSPDGKVVLFFNWNGTVIYLWNVESGFVRTLQGHQGEVNAAAFSPDGNWVASISADKKLRLWSTHSEESRVLGVHRSNPTSLSFANHGSRFITATEDGQVIVWSSSDGSGKTINESGGEVSAIAFSPDDQVIAWSQDDSVTLWNFTTKRRQKFVGHRNTVASLAFSPTGQSLASASSDGTVRVWTVVSGESNVLQGHGNQVWAVAFHPSGRFLASAGQDGIVRFWDPAGEKPFKVLRGHQSFIYDLKFLPDAHTVVTSANDGTVRLWNFGAETGRLFSGHTDDINDVAWAPDGRTFATGSKDRTVRIWDTATGSSTVLAGHTGEIIKLAYSSDGTKLASAGFDHTIRVWDLANGQSSVLRGHDNAIWDIAFSPNGDKLASAGLDGTIRLWELRSGASRVLRGHEGPVRSVVFSPDGTSLASGSSDRTVRLWQASSSWSRVFRGHEDAVYRVAFSPDGRLIASGSDDRTLRIWNVETGDSKVLRGHKDRLRTVSFLSNGNRLLSAADDKTLRIWSLEGDNEKILRGHRALIYQAAVSPNGRLAASASADRTVRVWDLSSGSLIGVHRHEADVKQLAFSPDGHYLLSVSDDQTARLWQAREIQEMPDGIEGLGSWLSSVTRLEINPESE